MIRIGVDPGYRQDGQGCACGLSVNHLLRAVWYDRPTHGAVDSRRILTKALKGIRVDRAEIVWELPQYDSRSNSIPIDVLIRLAGEGGMLAGMLATMVNAGGPKAETPRDWKGSIPKPIHHLAFWKTLTEAERVLLGGSATFRVIQAAVESGAARRWKNVKNPYPSNFTTHNLLDGAALACGFRMGAQ